MRIAYLIIAHQHYKHLRRLVEGLNDEGVSFFLHLDAKNPEPDWIEEYDIHVLAPQVVSWGGFSQVEVTLRLMRLAAEKASPDYFVLLSGVDYPLRSNLALREKFKREQAEYINILEGFQTTKPAQRLTKYHFQHLNRRKNSLGSLAGRALEKVVFSLGIRRKVSFKPFVGSNWFALSSLCVRYIFDFLDQNPDYLKSFSFSLCADEVFFHSIIGNSSFFENCQHNLTYADWQVANPPAVIKNRHVEYFINNREVADSYGIFEPFFARKFTDDSADLVAKIDSELRDSKPRD